MPTLLQELAEKLAWESTSWSAIELRVEAVTTHPVLPGARLKCHYIETGDGARFGEEVSEKSDGTSSRQIRFFDGARGGSITFEPRSLDKQMQAVLRDGYGLEPANAFAFRPLALTFRYLVKKPLHLALPDGKELGRAKLLGRDCVAVRFEKAFTPRPMTLIDLTYYIDLQTGVPLQLEMARDGVKLLTWSALSFDEIDGRHLARSSEEIGWAADGTASRSRRETITFVKFDGTYPLATFRPTIEPGILIKDAVKRTMTLPKQVSTESSLGKLGGPQPDAKTEAVPPRGWDAWASPVFLGGGVLLVVVAAGLALRRMFRPS